MIIFENFIIENYLDLQNDKDVGKQEPNPVQRALNIWAAPVIRTAAVLLPF